MRVVPLHYVAAREMQRIIDPMAGRASIVAVDDDRNTMTLSGSSQEINGILDMIAIFDVDMMRGKPVVSVTVSASPDAIAADLRKVFGTERDYSSPRMNCWFPPARGVASDRRCSVRSVTACAGSSVLNL